MKQAIPMAVVGFLVGALAGFQWGNKAKSKIGESVRTEFQDGVVRVEVDTVQAARSGLADPINDAINGLFE